MYIFSIDGPLMRALNVVADVLLLHLLWLLCSLPIITIGASSTALYYTCMKNIRTKEGYLTRNFFQSFRENFKQSTIIWIALLIIGCLFFWDFQIAFSIQGIAGNIMTIGCGIFLLPYLFILLYIFPVQAKFENTIKDNLKNALFMSLRHFPLTLLLLIIFGSFLIFGYTTPQMAGLLLICGAGLIAYLTSPIYIQIFRNYIPGEAENDLEISGETFDLNKK